MTEPSVISVKGYLIISSNGGVRVTKNPPETKRNEIAMKIDVEVPRSMFFKPNIEFKLVIPQSAARPTTIPVELMGNIERNIEEATGLRVTLHVEREESDGSSNLA